MSPRRTALKAPAKSARSRGAHLRSAQRSRPRPPDDSPQTSVIITNRQKSVRVDVRLLRHIVHQLIRELPGVTRCELGIQIVEDEEMTSVNETFLRHSGPTDVISFDHRDAPSNARIYGELFICADEAVRQARRYQTSWQQELVRYLAHGILHLTGHDDRTPAVRRRMKREEDRLLQQLCKSFPLRNLQLAVKSAHD